MVNPFLNPVFAFKAVKSYLLDIGRIWRITHEQMKRYVDKMADGLLMPHAESTYYVADSAEDAVAKAFELAAKLK